MINEIGASLPPPPPTYFFPVAFLGLDGVEGDGREEKRRKARKKRTESSPETLSSVGVVFIFCSVRPFFLLLRRGCSPAVAHLLLFPWSPLFYAKS